jgi:sugar lactone lactonase YvrE
VLEYDPRRASRTVATGLLHNGIALSGDGATLVVNETGKYRVWRRRGGQEPVSLGVAAGLGAARQPPGYPTT